ncbi:hypothetical protein ROE7235_01774 [Roseibaca ekhonensis]|jgi:hypothetical protein|uniref:Hydrogenase expression/formation protein HupK n=1 Tax=Roseinatronobacter ekhonensis TaxID=254356 RepID=A0A3B0M8M8_9RHOB|nr:hydrogenase expression/formation protein HupK [Roseibaca ekhonensis]SUZ32023.1 hypothetical protein ROE7235_01774 [Roseibaca ekhonensis]
MSGELVINQGAQGWVFNLPDPPPLAQVLAGKTPEAAAQLLARIFNLCGTAQGMAARLSAQRPDGPRALDGLARDVVRDHLLALCITLPRICGLPVQPLPQDWQAMGDLSGALWGGPRPMVLQDWLNGGRGFAPLANAVCTRFPGRLAASRPLPFACATSVGRFEPLENSPAMRHAQDALLRQAEAAHGRGPLWRLLGRICDAEDAALGRLPAPQRRDDGTALVPAARGVYALRLHLKDGRVGGISRSTPTDHMLASGGALRSALDSVRDMMLARIVLALHDPCLPTRLEETAHA